MECFSRGFFFGEICVVCQLMIHSIKSTVLCVEWQPDCKIQLLCFSNPVRDIMFFMMTHMEWLVMRAMNAPLMLEQPTFVFGVQQEPLHAKISLSPVHEEETSHHCDCGVARCTDFITPVFTRVLM